ncbi:MULTISPECIES: Maf family protein [Hyphobacterium]|uniref:dTTP/UTP pyrophosphatase n=1 Tax=Hyphobacterium vulgare TaxID=1736751 RepID=A0ABV7A0P0_9PROT
MTKPRLILASASPRRLQLLDRIGIVPDAVLPSDIDESEIPGETPRDIALRLAHGKADACPDRDAFVLAADTVVAQGRRTLPKAETVEQAEDCLRRLSGGNHRVWTGVAVRAPSGQITARVSESRVRFKRLSETEIRAYLASGEWRGKAGGYALQGMAEAFIVQIVGSPSGIIGLPLHETVNLLQGAGFPVHGASI